MCMQLNSSLTTEPPVMIFLCLFLTIRERFRFKKKTLIQPAALTATKDIRNIMRLIYFLYIILTRFHLKVAKLVHE